MRSRRLRSARTRPGVRPRHLLAAAAIIAVAAAWLLWSGRPPICPCGRIALWHPALDAGNSQHLADWYTPSHVIHGFLFYAAGAFMLRRWPIGRRLVLATAIEAAWEVAENAPAIIDRYRTATIALGYTGDSVVNSVADIGWMMLGFLLASRLRPGVTVALAITFELLALWAVRDNLTLNIVMLVAPIDAIRVWQAGG